MVEIGYMGNRGTGLGLSEELRRRAFAIPEPVAACATRQSINQLTRQVPNPFYGIPEFAGGGLTNKTVGAQQLLRPYPQFTGLTTTTNDGFSWYHSLQVRVERTVRERLHALRRLHLVEVHGGGGRR